MSASDLAPIPPILAFMNDASGNVVACRVKFEPTAVINPSDVFQNGTISWSTRAHYPYVGGRNNDIWTAQVVSGSQLIMIHICDYITWNTPIGLHCDKDQVKIRHVCEKYQTPAHGAISGYDSIPAGKYSTNFKVIVPAKNLGYHKCVVFKFFNYDGGVLNLDKTGGYNSTIYLGLLDLEKRAIHRMPMSNIHDNGKICLEARGCATALTPLPSAIFNEFASSPGNLDLAYTDLLEHLYFEPIPETEDEHGTPWLELKTEKTRRYGAMALSVPDFWSRFNPLIQEFLKK